MILYSLPPSPFGRKVKLAAHSLGLMDKLTVKAANTLEPEGDFLALNPLAKLPVLVVDSDAIFDSRVILEYLDSLAGGGKLIPASGRKRFDVLTRASVADGILDAALLVVYESRFRPADKRVDSVVNRHLDRIIRSLGAMAQKGYSAGGNPDMADIGLACALDYLDFRKPLEWRDYAPHLQKWMEGFAEAVPGYRETMPRD